MKVIVIGGVAAGTKAAAKIKRRWMLVCSITGGIYFLSLLAVTAICFGGNYHLITVRQQIFA